jgi:hypothetical protein
MDRFFQILMMATALTMPDVLAFHRPFNVVVDGREMLVSCLNGSVAVPDDLMVRVQRRRPSEWRLSGLVDFILMKFRGWVSGDI